MGKALSWTIRRSLLERVMISEVWKDGGRIRQALGQGKREGLEAGYSSDSVAMKSRSNETEGLREIREKVVLPLALREWRDGATTITRLRGAARGAGGGTPKIQESYKAYSFIKLEDLAHLAVTTSFSPNVYRGQATTQRDQDNAEVESSAACEKRGWGKKPHRIMGWKGS